MTSEDFPAGGRALPPHRGLRAAVAALAVAAALTLTGCTSLPTVGGGTSSEPVSGTQAASGATAAATTDTSETAAPGSAQKLAQTAGTKLTALGRQASHPSSAQMTQAMIQAGASGGTIEVSRDVTPTGLQPEAIEVSARVDNQCVVGQVRDGKADVAVLPVLATGKCFVGDQD